MVRCDTYIIGIKGSSSEVLELLKNAKLLYNRANYINRQRFFRGKKPLTKFQLINLFTGSEQYGNLPAQVSQQVLITLDKDWKSFKTLNKKFFNKTLQNFKGKPKPPKYVKGDFKSISVPGNNLNVKGDNKVKIPRTNYRLRLRGSTKIKDIKISYYYGKIKFNVSYEKVVPKTGIDSLKAIGIDLGLNNLCTITQNNQINRPWIINGRTLKSINQYFNKQRAKLVSQKELSGDDTYNSKKLLGLSLWRSNKINDYLHKVSRMIIDSCLEEEIGKIVIGNNKGWKQEINIGKKNNQNFVNIPFYKLIEMIKYKAEEYGIEVIVTEESYTSKIDHLALEPLGKQEKYLGKRIKRGLFKSSVGRIINADVNGAIGILRKVNVVSDKFLNSVGNSSEVSLPYRIKII